MDIQNGTMMSGEEKSQYLSKQIVKGGTSMRQKLPEISMLTIETIEEAEEASYRAHLYAIEHREELEKMDMKELSQTLLKVMYPEIEQTEDRDK